MQISFAANPPISTFSSAIATVTIDTVYLRHFSFPNPNAHIWIADNKTD